MENPPCRSGDISILGEFLTTNEFESYSIMMQSGKPQTSKRWKFT